MKVCLYKEFLTQTCFQKTMDLALLALKFFNAEEKLKSAWILKKIVLGNLFCFIFLLWLLVVLLSL